MDMYNHVLLEVFCLNPGTENIVNCKSTCPTYECIVKGCNCILFSKTRKGLYF